MNYKEIIAELQKQELSVEEFAFDDYKSKWYELSPDGKTDWSKLNIPNIGKCEEIKQVGGEGQGESWYSVKYFPQHDVYIRVDGYYTSYHGTDFNDGWDCCKEVKPIEKTIVVYEKV